MAAAENSFDIACKLDMQEVSNAINQAKREIETRYDLKGSKNEIVQENMDIVITAPDDMKLKAVLDILQSKLHRRGIDLKALTASTGSFELEFDHYSPISGRIAEDVIKAAQAAKAEEKE